MEMAEGVQITVPLTADAPSNSIYWDDYQYSSLPWYYRQSKSHVDLIRLRLVRIRVRTCDSQRVKDQGVTAVPELQRRCVFPSTADTRQIIVDRPDMETGTGHINFGGRIRTVPRWEISRRV